jgi:hypothetical protein
MGYFSNGSEGAAYEDRYCDKCINSHGGCWIWELHFMRNYKDCNNEDSILHVLIPRSTDGLENGQCVMFKEKSHDCCAPALVEALEMVRHYRDSHMGASSSKVTQIYRGEMNDKIDAALAAAYGEKE